MAIVLLGLIVSLSGCQQITSRHALTTKVQSKQEIQDECREIAESYRDIYEKAKKEQSL